MALLTPSRTGPGNRGSGSVGFACCRLLCPTTPQSCRRKSAATTAQLRGMLPCWSLRISCPLPSPIRVPSQCLWPPPSRAPLPPSRSPCPPPLLRTLSPRQIMIQRESSLMCFLFRRPSLLRWTGEVLGHEERPDARSAHVASLVTCLVVNGWHTPAILRTGLRPQPLPLSAEALFPMAPPADLLSQRVLPLNLPGRVSF